MVLTVSHCTYPVWLVMKWGGARIIKVAFGKFNQVMAHISATVSGIIFILENVNTFSGIWYVTMGKTNVLFSLPVLKHHPKKFAFCGKGLQYAFSVFFFFSYTLHHYCSFLPSSLSSPIPTSPLSSRSTFSPYPFWKDQETHRYQWNTEQSIASYDKIRQNPSYQGCTKQPSKRKRVPKAVNRVRDNTQSHC